MSQGIFRSVFSVTVTLAIALCSQNTWAQNSEFPLGGLEDTTQGLVGGEDAAKVTVQGKVQPGKGNKATVFIFAEIQDGWYIYGIHQPEGGPVTSELKLTASKQFKVVGKFKEVIKPKIVFDWPGDKKFAVHKHYEKAIWSVEVELAKDVKAADLNVTGYVTAQVCNPKTCLPPEDYKFEKAKIEKVVDTKISLIEEEKKEPVTVSFLIITISSCLLGGFILNFMPCVLPVIGLKIVSFAQQAGEDRSRVLGLNIAYSLGILSVCMALASLITFAQLVWGAQFQSQEFLIVLIGVVFAMSLSFLGVWEIPVPSFVGGNKANELAHKEGYAGAFFKGILTTVLATPCSGPFLGAIFGTLLQYPAYVAFIALFFIGIGLAMPYLLIGAFPSLIRMVPKPGAWMETFKQVCGLALLGAVAFLFMILQNDYLKATFWLMIGLWVFCWCLGKAARTQSVNLKWITRFSGFAIALGVGWLAFSFVLPQNAYLPWKPYSEEALAEAQRQGKTVMVDFTADWCLSCKLNLKTAIERKKVLELVNRNDIVPMIVDMTLKNESHDAALRALNSSSIPVLAIYPSNDPDNPIVLRDLVTQNDVLKALEKAGPSKKQPVKTEKNKDVATVKIRQGNSPAIVQ